MIALILHLKKGSLFFLIISLVLLSIKTSAQPGSITSHEENSQIVRDLSGFQWKMKQMLPGQGEKAGLYQLPSEDIETLVWNPAQVPGDVYTDLWKAGAIDDPYFGRNSVKAQWVMHYEWWYATQFSITEDLKDKVVRIDFEGVDYSCDVWLNGVHLGSHEGSFSPFSFDVTEALRSSKRKLESQNMLIIKLNPPPQVNAKVAGRKTPWFGDYWRDLIPFGIWRPIKMVSTGAVRVADLYAKSALNADGSANVTLEVSLENTASEAKKMTVVASIAGSNFESDTLNTEITQVIPPGIHTVKKSILVKNPKLWWPWDLGDQNLYDAKISVKEGEINHDFSETTFGIREVKMEWNPGFSKEEVSFPRTVILNGKNHFIRSACWGGPPDIFVGRTDPSEYKELIDLAKAANMNNIRIFGWHPPEIPEFYQLCNEAGLTVWQDVVPLGTGNLPRDKAFLDITIAEAVAVIKERRNNPCLILMEGGEEMFLRSSDAQFTNNFLLALGDSLQKYLDLPYVPDSPLTSEKALEAGYKPKEAVHALAYFYGMGNWLMEDWFSALDFPIVPELAITSVPSVESLKKFIPENEMWPPGLSWGHHWADLDRLRIQNFDAFGDEKTGSLEEFVNATQDAQGIIFQLSVEHFRRGKPSVSGISLCHFITYWPDMKWGIIDNYQQPKRSYDYVKRAYQPLLVNLQFEKRRWKKEEAFKGQIWIVNDYYESYPGCTVLMNIRDDHGKLLQEKSFSAKDIQANSSKKFFEIEAAVLKNVTQNFYIELALLDKNAKELSSNNYMFLIGDQATASKKFKEMGDAIRQRNGKYTYGNYYRFFPDMIRENGKDHQSDIQHPRAKGFPEKE